MWEYERHSSLSRPLKSHPQEVQNAFDNAEQFFRCLCEGIKPAQIVRGYIHSEPLGVKAFDQSGPGPNKKAIRLYAFPDEESEVFHLITLGDKTTQKFDIRQCVAIATEILAARKSAPNSQAEDDHGDQTDSGEKQQKSDERTFE
ncbi:hypothetical protein BH10PLA2_BH10PLA2_39390 [soil metagenome]